MNIESPHKYHNVIKLCLPDAEGRRDSTGRNLAINTVKNYTRIQEMIKKKTSLLVVRSQRTPGTQLLSGVQYLQGEVIVGRKDQ